MRTPEEIREATLYLLIGIAMGGCHEGRDFVPAGWELGDWLALVWRTSRPRYIEDSANGWQLTPAGLDYIAKWTPEGSGVRANLEENES